MKDKLIQILRNAPDGVEQACDRPTVDAILAWLRCDGCKDWESLGGGICFSHTSPMNGTDMVVRPYDFCSHWEAK